MRVGHLHAHLRDLQHLKHLALRHFMQALRSGRLVAFVGSYATEDLNYPKWEDFLHNYALKFALPPEMRFPWTETALEKIKLKEAGTVMLDIIIEDWKRLTFGYPPRNDDKVRNGLAEKAGALHSEIGFFGLRDDRPSVGYAAPSEILESLGITRVITTNYDLEFEWEMMLTARERRETDRAAFFAKLIGDEKIVLDPKTRALSRRLPSGRNAHSDVFIRERPDRLIEFAIGAPDHDGHVLHLHGRATGGDEEHMIVSLGDYQRHYRRSGVAKLPFEHALKMLYAGNPVIFIGSGMTEAEVTNTLEDFVSDEPRHRLAPAFVLWSPEVDEIDPAKIATGVKDEVRRMEWYRRFGVLTIYDCDLLEQFDAQEAVNYAHEGKPRRIGYAVRALGEFAKAQILPFAWQREHFRSAQVRFDPSETVESPEGSRFDIWRHQPIYPDESLLDVFNSAHDPDFVGALTPQQPLRHRVDEPLFQTLFCGAPVKAIIDRPGSGHGYLAKVIARAFSRTLKEMGIETRAAVVNAGFACEIDSALALISGLFDGVTAFGITSEQAMSRTAALAAYETQMINQVVEGRLDRHLLLVINGMDRFFDTSGYPLSSELDNMMRRIVRAYRTEMILPDGKRRTIHDWVAQNDTVNPFTVILLGTPRVQRYLEGLGWRPEKARLDGQAKPPADGLPADDGGPPSSPHGDYAILGGEYEPGNQLRRTILDRNIKLRPAAATEALEKGNLALAETLKDGRIFERPAGEAHSNYLQLLKMKMGDDLSLAMEMRIARSRKRSTGDLRHSFLSAYLRSSAVSKVLAPANLEQLSDLCLDVLSSLAFFGHPVDYCVLADVPRIARRLEALTSDDPALAGQELTMLEQTIGQLVSMGLVLKFDPFPESMKGWDRYGIHRTVMTELRDRFGVPISEAKLSAGFNLSLFASQLIDDYKPEQDMHSELGGLVDALLLECETFEKFKPWEAEPIAYLRAAMSVMRNYFTTSALLMLEPPPSPVDPSYVAPLSLHAMRLDRMIRIAEKLARARADIRKEGTCEGESVAVEGQEALYPDDLVWLHNELGVARLVQGDLYGARFALDAAEAVNRAHVEYGDELQNWLRIHLNQLHLDIERAKLNRAESRMLEIEHAVNRHVEMVRVSRDPVELAKEGRPVRALVHIDRIIRKYGRDLLDRTRVVDPEYPADAVLAVGLIAGYRGLCAYLRGNFRPAIHQFDIAVTILRNIGEQRAAAIFLRHSSSLHASIGQHEPANEQRKIGQAAADSVRQMDLAYLYRVDEISSALVEATRQDHAKMLQTLVEAVNYSVYADMFRIRVEARRTLAEMRFQGGDYDGALEHAADALAVATRFGFSLRKISLRILTGRILIERDDPESGKALLRQAIVNADRVGYQRVVELAQQLGIVSTG